MLCFQLVGWVLFSAALVSFIEHQVHQKLMHRRSIGAFRRTYESHALVHHRAYSKVFSDKPVTPGEDREIRLTVHKAPIKVLPFVVGIALFSWLGAAVFVATMILHHWVWNNIHLEMHKPEQRVFSNWRSYRFLARNHWLHHRYQNKNFNVVFPLADYLLGTRAEANDADIQCMHEQFGTRVMHGASAEMAEALDPGSQSAGAG